MLLEPEDELGEHYPSLRSDFCACLLMFAVGAGSLSPSWISFAAVTTQLLGGSRLVKSPIGILRIAQASIKAVLLLLYSMDSNQDISE